VLTVFHGIVLHDRETGLSAERGAQLCAFREEQFLPLVSSLGSFRQRLLAGGRWFHPCANGVADDGLHCGVRPEVACLIAQGFQQV
jgi:hypothetical protein